MNTDNQEMQGKVLCLNGGEGGSIWSAVWTLLIIVVCLLVTGAIAVRTDFVRQWIEESFSKKVGTEVAIKSTAIVWPYVLVLEDVRTGEGGPQDGLQP